MKKGSIILLIVLLLVVLSIIVVFVIRRKRKTSNSMPPPFDNNTNQQSPPTGSSGDGYNLTPERRYAIQKIASDLHYDISSWLYTDWGNAPHMDESLYEKAAILPDNELRFLAYYYKNFLSNGISLFQDMKGEYYPFWWDQDEVLMEKLQQLNLI